MNLSKYCLGAAIPHIYFKDYCNEILPDYSLAEQQRIASQLDKISHLITLRKRQLSKLDELVKSRFVEMFGEPMTTPKGWPTAEMAEVVDRIGNGRSFVCESFARAGDNPAILKLGAATWGYYKPEENKALKVGATYYPDCEVKPGDLLFTRKNTLDLVGKCAYVRKTPPKLMLPDLIFRLETNERIDKVYLANLINHDGSRAAIQRLASGSAGSMPNISKARLLGLTLPLPPLALQREFAAFVAKVDKLAFKAKASLEKLETLKKAMMQKYFN
jgi:type I restriction enzyme S subunit